MHAPGKYQPPGAIDRRFCRADLRETHASAWPRPGAPRFPKTPDGCLPRGCPQAPLTWLEGAWGSVEATVAPGMRWARAGFLSVVGAVTGTVAHASAGGGTPPLSTSVVLAVLLTFLAAPLLGRPASGRRVVLLLLAGEALIHVVLSMGTGGHHQVAPRVPGASLAGAALQGHVTGSHETSDRLLTGMVWLAQQVPGSDALMTCAHLAAFLVIGLWLAIGERALWAVIRLIARPLAAVVRAVAARLTRAGGVRVGATTDPRGPGPCPEVTLPAARMLAHRVVCRRGPPRVLVTPAGSRY